MTNQDEKKTTKTYETKNGYIISSNNEDELELDPESLLEPDIKKDIYSIGASDLNSKEIILIKDGKEYRGQLDKFSLTESFDGTTKIKVVFYLAK